jgi:transcriptional regulator with XRE-family HTH domain
MSITERLQAIRKKQGLTQEKFAEVLGLSHSAYKTYERGERVIPSTVYETLFEKFAVDPTWLFTGLDAISTDKNYSILEEVVSKLTQRLAEQGKSYPPEKIGKMVKLLYEFRLQNGGISDAYLDDFIGLAS